MSPSSWFSVAEASGAHQVLWQEDDTDFRRIQHPDTGADTNISTSVLTAVLSSVSGGINRLTHEHDLKEYLDGTWAIRPLELLQEQGRSILVFEDPGGELLSQLVGQPMEVERFLRLAIGIAAAMGKMHQQGLVHRDIKPAHVLVNSRNGDVRLTGFGIASRVPRERQPPAPPQFIAGTLAYMAPEQTGRMNRSIDSRSDLYALGVTLYEMLTGTLPFSAADVMEWIHCHIARQPASPAARLAGIPLAISAIVMKLLAKAAEDRYQTAAGLEHDLRRCLADWNRRQRIGRFPLGEHDIPSRLLIPEKLYGRERDIDILLAAFDAVLANGPPELVLVSGYAGIGKSAVINELHKVLVASRGLFAVGKFDQYKRDIPYSTLAQAFQRLVRPLLGKHDTELSAWRDALLQALGPNGRLMVDVVPELKLIIGEQPPVPELLPQDAQRRFQLVFQRFIGVFARPDHPLVLFLDDLQWLDAATLDLLEDLTTRSHLRHCLIVGAYRDNEVPATHPLMRKLDAIKAAGGKIAEVTLVPLAREHVAQLIAEALHCEPEHAAPLADLVHDKTGGNPFFAIQFLSSLAEEGLLAFDHDAARWSWDRDGIQAKGYTDNVVDLMVGKLARLPDETQRALRLLACLGNVADTATLAIVLGGSEAHAHVALWPSVHQELVEHTSGAYRFVHDRVQEAAYSLITNEQRAEMHLRIGKLLAAHTPAERREEAIFDIVNQLNRGAALIAARDEAEQLASLNLIAGKRAKASTAYASALNYLLAGAALLAEDAWERRHELIFELEQNLAECEFLTGALTAAEQRLASLSARAATTVERASVTCLRVDLYTAQDQGSRAIAVGLDYLRHLGIDWSAHPTEDAAHQEYARIWSQLRSRDIETIIDLPLMTDAASLATLDVLTRLGPSAYYSDANLRSLIVCRAVNLSLEHGNGDGSCYAYAVLGLLAGPHFGDYQAGLRFGRLGYELVERRGLKRFQARTYMNYAALIMSWTRDIRGGRDLVWRAFETAQQIGDLTYAGYCFLNINTNFLAAGDPLDEAQAEAERGLAFAQSMRFGFVIDSIAGQLGLICTLRGLTAAFGRFDDELELERRFSSTPDLPMAEVWYWTRKLQARFFAGDYVGALDASSRAQRLLWATPSMFETAEYHYYAGLSQAACCEPATTSQQDMQALVAHHRQLEVWAAVCPENFANRAALLAAEIARIEGRAFDAMGLYEQAIRSARANGFVHNEALAYELAARFYMTRGFEEFARVYLRNARDGYVRWKANGKVRQLDALYPFLRDAQPAHTAPATIAAPIEHLDFTTVAKVLQAASGEMVLEKLIEALMRMAIEHTGAERGLLLLLRGSELRLEAEAVTSADAIIVRRQVEPAAALPDSIIHYVIRAREIVILDDASADSTFSADTYVRERGARSILCLPLVKQSETTGVLYLENNLTPRVFTPSRVAVLRLLALQAAISLENTYLYGDLAEREAKIRRLVDANIIGIVIWDLDGRIIDSNDAFLRMIGHDRDEITRGTLEWTALNPAEWRPTIEQRVAGLRSTGVAPTYERELVRKDGSRAPVLFGGAIFNATGDQAVGFAVDLTDRKRAEEAARESEQRYQEVQRELAHASRIATMGQLTASIAHEVNQPIAAAIIQAETALRWLGRQPPDLARAARAIGRVVQDGRRAADIVSRTRALASNAPAQIENVAINAAILEVIGLTRYETSKSGVWVRTQLAVSVPVIQADRVQLQQVILNLVMNAVEAMSEMSDGPRDLLITTGTESDCVLVAIRDSGPGLSEVERGRVFEPFYTTKLSGLGIGLAICRSIVEAHGGRLWASANMPRGAAFQFTLPVGPD